MSTESVDNESTMEDKIEITEYNDSDKENDFFTQHLSQPREILTQFRFMHNTPEENELEDEFQKLEENFFEPSFLINPNPILDSFLRIPPKTRKRKLANDETKNTTYWRNRASDFERLNAHYKDVLTTQRALMTKVMEYNKFIKSQAVGHLELYRSHLTQTVQHMDSQIEEFNKI